MEAAQILTVVAIVVGILGGSVGVVVWGRGTIMKATNEMLERAVLQERTERQEVERRCAADIARLTGRVDTLTDQHSDRVARKILEVFRDEGVFDGRR